PVWSVVAQSCLIHIVRHLGQLDAAQFPDCFEGFLHLGLKPEGHCYLFHFCSLRWLALSSDSGSRVIGIPPVSKGEWGSSIWVVIARPSPHTSPRRRLV